ncbi:MAG: hypothetical protein KC418_01655 [Anaerolineales bacterium]|nr:hypothetical protein [Anaerolineales bacterium]MCB8953868.1 hypothetical protein [Ardenticatenales bacterium]
MYWRILRHTLKFLLLTCLVAAVLVPEWPAFQDTRYRLSALIGQRNFDFVVWGARALAAKADAGITASAAYLDEPTRQQQVLDYLDLISQSRRLNSQIEAIYGDPNMADPQAASASLQQELAQIRAQMTQRQSLVESILQQQVAHILVEQGFGVLDATWPPVQMQMTPLPLILIVSPRDEIRRTYGIPLVPGLTTPAKEALEESVLADLDMSALVVPIGGLGIYPAMIIETSDINFLADTVAHEWAHHWLSLHPLGIRYAVDNDLRTINETVASILGKEIGAMVIERYYPRFVPPPPAPVEESPPAPDAPPPFDFRAEMAETRKTMDGLLAEGRVAAAEMYMEARRRVFVANGYQIRKLNQAYFAFYGAYADTPGATGEDPIGPAINAVRADSATLHEFMQKMARIRQAQDLFDYLPASSASPASP